MVSFAKFHRHGLGAPPSRFMRALCFHYGVELQHFSLTAITVAAVFTAVCEGYLGLMPHWELWLHLYRGELFNAPTGTTGLRKHVRAGCLNLVLKTKKTERPCEYIPVGLSSNHAGWDSQWFYLRNDFLFVLRWLVALFSGSSSSSRSRAFGLLNCRHLEQSLYLVSNTSSLGVRWFWHVAQ